MCEYSSAVRMQFNNASAGTCPVPHVPGSISGLPSVGDWRAEGERGWGIYSQLLLPVGPLGVLVFFHPRPQLCHEELSSAGAAYHSHWFARNSIKFVYTYIKR